MKNRQKLLALPVLVACASFLLSGIAVEAQLSNQLAATQKTTARPRLISGASLAPVRRLAPLRIDETPEGTRVRLASDSPLDDYRAYRTGERFFVLLPRAEAPLAASALEGRGFSDVRFERSGEDLLISFGVQAGVAARVSQSFNRLDVFFDVQQQQQQPPPQQQRQQTGGDGSDKTPATPSPSPAAGSTQSTGPETNPPAAAGSSSSTNTGATESTSNTAAGNTATAVAETSPAAKTASSRTPVVPPEKAQPVRITRFDKPPVIDGKLDEDVWKQATVFRDFYQIRPGDNIQPSQPTEALIGFDSKFLYMAFRAYDEPGKVRANIAKRDNIFDDDWVGVILDTFNDQRKAYEFFFNPFGVQADGIMTEGVNEDFSIDVVMDSKGVVTDKGYTVEVAIPFKSLRYEAGKDKHWGLHVIRTIKRNNNEQDSWMPISRDKSGTLNQAGRITGLEGISTERTLEVIPSLTISESGRRVKSPTPGGALAKTLDGTALSSERFVNSPIDFDPGVTVKFGLTPTTTLDFTYNPDFAQVEADATVVTANQRFPIFFEEKRPFFLEGIDIFQTPLQAVHTRAIVDPDYAVKLSGKRGRNTFGILMASDNAPGNYNEDERTEIRENMERFLADQQRPLAERQNVSFDNRIRLLDRNASIGVLRLKRDVGKENSLGLIATTYNFVDQHNHLGGFDGRFRINPQTVMTFQVLGTNTRRYFYNPDLDKNLYRTGNGLAYRFRYDKQGRHFGWNFDGQGLTKDYRADVGFTRRRNTNREGLFVYYSSEPKPKAKLISWRLSNVVSTNFDFQGRQQNWEDEVFFSMNMPRQTFLGFGFNAEYERLFEEEFGARRLASGCGGKGQRGCAGAFAGNDPERQTYKKAGFIVFETTPAKKYYFYLFLLNNHGPFDLDFGAGSKFPRVSPGALAVRSNPICIKDSNDPRCFAPKDPGPGNAWTVESSFTYQPTSALRASLNYVKSSLRRYDTDRLAFDDNIFSLRTTYQFTRFLFARARVDYSTLSANVRPQLLMGWTPNPGTAFYVGYNDDLNRNGFNPFTNDLEPGFRRNGRIFFIKASYLFRRSF